MRCYNDAFGLQRALIVEDDSRLRAELSGKCSRILFRGGSKTLKGLESPCVIWLGHRPVPANFAGSPLEAIYTSLTRTSSVLVLVLSDRMEADARSCLGLIEPSNVIFWSRIAFEKFKKLRLLVDFDPDPDSQDE